jgi:hypothetical protein
VIARRGEKSAPSVPKAFAMARLCGMAGVVSCRSGLDEEKKEGIEAAG